MTEAIEKQAVKQTVQNNSLFCNIDNFNDAVTMVRPLADSDLVPDTYKHKIGECIIALELAQRIGASPLAVMQNLNPIHGRPSWSSQFLISCINGSGMFSPLRYKMSGKPNTDERTCVAWATDKSGEVLESIPVSIAMAKAEGWYNRNGSKWKTMPELMLHYRAATFFARLYCPELTMGMRTTDEVEDITDVTPKPKQSIFKAEPKPEQAEAEQTVEEQPTAEAVAEEPKQETANDTALLDKALLDSGVQDVTASDIKKLCEQSNNRYNEEFVIKNLAGYVKWVRDCRAKVEQAGAEQ